MMSPLLQVRRLVVTGSLGLDISFDPGLSVIHAESTGNDPRSTNKAGKTGLVELIQHGLGRRQGTRQGFHFAPIIDKLQMLWMETELNESVLTIGRSLRDLGARAAVVQGGYVGEQTADIPAERVGIPDLSSVFLDQLSIPQVYTKTARGDLEPFSFPLLMRAFILHQNHSFGAVLDKVMPETRRTEILGFLTQIIPESHFRRQEQIADVQVQIQDLEAGYAAIQSFLYENGVPSLTEAENLVEESEQRHQAATEARRRLQAEMRSAAVVQEGQGRVDVLRQRLLEGKDQLARQQRNLMGLQQESERIAALIASLKSDLQKARRTAGASILLSTVDFQACPRCLQVITEEMRAREAYARCSLCDRPFASTSDSPPKLVVKAPDIEAQIEEAQSILSDVEEEISAALEVIQRSSALQAQWGAELEEEVGAYIAPSVDLLLQRNQDVAAAEAQREQASSLLDQARALDAMRIKLEKLHDHLQELQESPDQYRDEARRRLGILRDLFVSILRDIDFPDLRNASVDGRTLMPIINGESYQHTGAALTGLAVVCYHLALLQFALRESCYFPRFLVIDSPAVGDLNENSHDQLLDYLGDMHQAAAEKAEAAGGDIPWQIILTERRVTPRLTPNIVLTISNARGKMLLRQAGRRGSR